LFVIVIIFKKDVEIIIKRDKFYHYKQDKKNKSNKFSKVISNNCVVCKMN
jgi:hypothetical protein